MTERVEPEVQCPFCQFKGWTRNSETAQHLKNARRELLLAVKAAVEAGLTCLDEEEKSRQVGKSEARQVPIE